MTPQTQSVKIIQIQTFGLHARTKLSKRLELRTDPTEGRLELSGMTVLCPSTHTAFSAFCEWEELKILFSAPCKHSLPKGNPKV